MKATGIVRRIDDLGRIVIPKEIRRTMRIREGDPLEIYTSPDGEVIFKKYSPVGEISCTASQYADVLSKVGGCPAVICDRDHVIAVSGMAKKEVIERRVSGSLEDLIEQRKSHVYRSREDQRLNPIEGIDRYAIAAAPILSQGDVNGAVIMLSGERARPGCRNVLRQADGGIKIREGPRPPAFISFSLRSFKALVPQMYAYRSNTHRRYKYARYQQRPFTPRHVTPHIGRSSSSVVIV